MFVHFFFAIGIINNILLTTIFLLRATNNLLVVGKYGWIYLLLIIPTLYALLLKKPKEDAKRYSIFLLIFLAFLIIETVYDHVLHISFRESWILLIPYLVLYFASNYGFAAMTWKTSKWKGIVMTSLFAIQIFVNILSH